MLGSPIFGNSHLLSGVFGFRKLGGSRGLANCGICAAHDLAWVQILSCEPVVQSWRQPCTTGSCGNSGSGNGSPDRTVAVFVVVLDTTTASSNTTRATN